VTRWERTRAVLNWVNLSTPLGLLVARAGGATLQPGPGPGGVRIATGYRLPLPAAGAFTVGDVVTTRHGPDYLLGPHRAALLRHEVSHASQYALLGPFFLPAYGAAAAWSWLVSGEPGGRNPFERWAGLAAGGYRRHPMRPALRRAAQLWRARSRNAAES